VTRLKENAVIHEVLEEKTVRPESPVIRDAVVRLGSQQNVMKHSLRLVQTMDSEGSLVTILTNDFTLRAEEVCDIYRQRWQIELFFKWIKQHLVLKRLYGKSEAAVYNQLRIALVTYCLLILMQLKAAHRGRLLVIYKCVRLNWDRDFTHFVRGLHQGSSRTSRGRRRLRVDRIFAETLKQYSDGDTEHLEATTYDPVI